MNGHSAISDESRQQPMQRLSSSNVHTPIQGDGGRFANSA
jgi:hypothetical protein